MIKFEDYNFPKLGYIKVVKFQPSQTDLDKLNLKSDISSEDFLLYLMKYNFEQKLKSGKIPKDKQDIYFDRLDFEYKEIVRLLFADYILLVYDVIKFCKENNILNSPSRGSMGGSCLLWVIGCTQIDPIKHNLLFERFISSSRTDVKEIGGESYIRSDTLADCDLDSMQSQKHLINEFLAQKFPNRTAAILNVSTFQSRILIKEVLKSYEEMNENDSKVIAAMIEGVFGKIESMDDAIERNPDFAKWANEHKTTIEICNKLYELARNKSVHASGIIICNDNTEDCIPLEMDNNREKIVCGYTMEDAQAFGIKLDNLGLKTLNILKSCLDLTNIKMEDIDVNDSSIYTFLNTSDKYYGIYQFEEGIGKNILRAVKPLNIDDVAIATSTGRPGAMKFVSDIVKTKEGRDKRTWDTRIDNIFNETYGVIIYQEQIMQLCGVMAKFTPQETNLVRKCIGKKLSKEIKVWKPKFIEQSINNGYKKEICEEIWQTFEDSGSYIFNKSHAYGVSYLAAICTYLKVNYTKEFFLALLENTTNEAKPIEEIQKIQEELPAFGIKLLGPDLLKSDINFTIDGPNIRYGLGFIKGIAGKTIEKLKQFRHAHSTKFDLFHSANEIGLNLGATSSLIQAGCLDEFLTQSRSRTVLEAQLWAILTDRERKLCFDYAQTYNYDLLKLVRDLNENLKDEKGKPYIKDSRRETIRKKYEKYKQIYNQNSKNEELCSWYFEKLLLGFSYTQDLTNIFKKKVPDILTIEQVNKLPENKTARFCGEITDVHYFVANNEKKTKCVRMSVKDTTGSIKVLLFNDKIGNNEDLNGEKFQDGTIVIVRGQKKPDAVFGEVVANQNITFFHRLADLPNET